MDTNGTNGNPLCPLSPLPPELWELVLEAICDDILSAALSLTA